MKTLFSCYGALCLLLLAACTTSPVESSVENVQLAAERSAVRYTPHAVPAYAKTAISALNEEEKKAYKQAVEEARSEVLGAYYRGAPVSEIDVLAEEAIRAHANNPYRYFLEQTVSGLALEMWLGEANPSVEAVARHTTRLLHNAHPDARALVPALEVMRGTWTSQRLRAAVEQLQHQARKPVSGKQCEGCTTPALEQAQTSDQRVAVLTFDEAQAAALERLGQAQY